MVNYIEELDMQLELFHDDYFVSWIEADSETEKGIIWDMELID
jgi:hypothetical protein